MTKLSQSEKSKSLTLFLKIFLTCLICLLSILDAPEYVQCTHIGVCEFLEVHGNLKPSQEAEKILTSIKKVINQPSSYFHAFFIEYYSHCPQRCGDLTFGQGFFENVGLSVPFYILSRYVYPDYKKILCFSFIKGYKILVKQELSPITITNKFLPSQPLQIISASIINS